MAWKKEYRSAGDSPIEQYMAQRDSTVEKNKTDHAGEYDPVILDGIVTDYGINRKGQVFSYKNNRLMSPCISQNKYKLCICYVKDNKRCYQGIWVDRLVALTYLPNPENCKYVYHINGDPLDDRVENLKWSNEKPIITAGLSREEIADMFNKIEKMYYEPAAYIESKTKIKNWIIMRIKLAINHMEEQNLEISAETFLSGFKPIIINGVQNDNIEINKFGIVYQCHGDVYRFGSLSTQGYIISSIGDQKVRVHRAVAETFIPNPENLPMVHHKNSATYDPCVWNLQWVTQETNMQEASDLGELKRGNDRGGKHNTDEQIHAVCRMICDRKHSILEIARETGVDRHTINMIRNGDAWQHISQHYNLPYVIYKHGVMIGEDPDTAKLINEKIRRKMAKSTYNKSLPRIKNETVSWSYGNSEQF